MQRIFVLAWLFFSLDLLWPVVSPLFSRQVTSQLPPQTTGINYLIIAPEGLATSAREWENYRRSTGYQTKTLILSTIDARSTVYIRNTVLEIYRSSQNPYPFFILIIGHAHADSPAYQSFVTPASLAISNNQISNELKRAYPQCLTSMNCEIIPGDDGFIINDDETFLPIAVGRIPAQKNEEVLSVIERTKKYEQTPPQGENLTRIELLASESLWGKVFNTIMEFGLKTLFTQFLPPEYQLHFLYGSATSEFTVPADQFRQEAIRRFNTDPTLLFYAGHGFHNEMAPVLTTDGKAQPIFTTQDASQINHADQSMIFAIACLLGAYDLPKEMDRSMAETLILSPKGPVGVYAASRITAEVDNLLLGEELLWRRTHSEDLTLGELIRNAESSYQYPTTETTFALWAGKGIFTPVYQLGAWLVVYPQKVAVWHRYTYNLFGDPALKLSFPRREIKLDSSLEQFTWDAEINFAGSVPMPPGTKVAVSLAIPLDRNIPRQLSPKKDSSIYEDVNQRLVARVYVPIDEHGRITGKIKFPATLPAGKYYLIAMGVDEHTTQTGYQPIYYHTLPYAVIPTSISGFIITSAFVCILKYRKPKIYKAD